MTSRFTFNHELLDHRERAWPVEATVEYDAFEARIVGTLCDKHITSADFDLLQEIADRIAGKHRADAVGEVEWMEAAE